MLRVSVLMPVFNAWPYLRASTEAILQQTASDFEFLIVDDGSTDQSTDYLLELASRDRRVRLTRHYRTDLAAVRNELVSEAQGELLIWADADDESAPERVERQWAYMAEHPECVAVGSWALAIGPHGRPIRRLRPPITHQEIDSQHISGIGGGILNPSACIRRSAVIAVGGYRPQFPPSEDYDLYLRLAEVGQLANIPDFLVKYRLHTTSATYARRQEMVDHAHQALREACQRRGRPAPQPPSPNDARMFPELQWSNWANTDGFHRSARYFAWRALCRSPRYRACWHELAQAVFHPPTGNSWWSRWVDRPSRRLGRVLLLLVGSVLSKSSSSL